MTLILKNVKETAAQSTMPSTDFTVRATFTVPLHNLSTTLRQVKNVEGFDRIDSKDNYKLGTAIFECKEEEPIVFSSTFHCKVGTEIKVLERLISMVGFAGYVRVGSPPRVADEPKASSDTSSDDVEAQVVDAAPQAETSSEKPSDKVEERNVDNATEATSHLRDCNPLAYTSVKQIHFEAGKWQQIMESFFNGPEPMPESARFVSTRSFSKFTRAGSDVIGEIIAVKTFNNGYFFEVKDHAGQTRNLFVGNQITRTLRVGVTIACFNVQHLGPELLLQQCSSVYAATDEEEGKKMPQRSQGLVAPPSQARSKVSFRCCGSSRHLSVRPTDSVSSRSAFFSPALHLLPQ